MVTWLYIVSRIIPITGFFGVSLGLFLLYLSLKIRMDFPERVRLEIDEHRDIYRFIRMKGRISPQDLVEEFEGIKPGDPAYLLRLKQCMDELRERSSERLMTLVENDGMFSLSDVSKKFFIYENPTMKELLRYIFYVYIRRQPDKLLE